MSTGPTTGATLERAGGDSVVVTFDDDGTPLMLKTAEAATLRPEHDQGR